MVIRHIYNQETTLEAAIQQDQDLALQAFDQEPLLSSLSPEQIIDLFDEMVANTKEYLVGW